MHPISDFGNLWKLQIMALIINAWKKINKRNIVTYILSWKFL